jgi:hypothetical protein
MIDKFKAVWDSAIIKSHEDLVANNNTQVTGKIRQEANEYVVQEWINTEFSVYRHSEITDSMVDKIDVNASGYDLLDPTTGLRIQAKYRAGKNKNNRWHMEQTRRTGASNTQGSMNGQVRYKDSEFDVIVFTSPTELSNDVTEEDFITIPVSELKDPKKPGFLVGRVPSKLVDFWKQKGAMNVLKQIRKEKIERSKNELL